MTFGPTTPDRVWILVPHNEGPDRSVWVPCDVAGDVLSIDLPPWFKAEPRRVSASLKLLLMDGCAPASVPVSVAGTPARPFVVYLVEPGIRERNRSARVRRKEAVGAYEKARERAQRRARAKARASAPDDIGDVSGIEDEFDEVGLAALAALGLRDAASTEEIQRAYRRAVAGGRLHPDQGGDPAAFRRVTELRDVALEHVGDR